MLVNLLKGGVLGGVIFFLWSAVSWMLLPWHNSYMSPLGNEPAVSEIIKATVPDSGLYVIPWHDQNSNHEEVMQKMVNGPFAIMAIHPNGVPATMVPNMVRGFLFSCLLAMMATFLLMRTRGLNFVQKVGFVKIAGLMGGAFYVFANWNWWGYPNAYLLVNIVDMAVGWGLVGVGLAKFVVKD